MVLIKVNLFTFTITMGYVGNSVRHKKRSVVLQNGVSWSREEEVLRMHMKVALIHLQENTIKTIRLVVSCVDGRDK